MATATFDLPFSASLMRTPHPSADAPSMADTLPCPNFNFDDLRERMNRFTLRFDAFIATGRKRVLESRNQFRIHIAELQEEQRTRRKDIEVLHLKSDNHAQALSKEAQETAEMHASIASLTASHDAHVTHRDRLRAQIGETQRAVAQRREAQQKHARYLDGQARFNAPELEFWEDCLCLRIEGAGREDRLQFVYTHVAEREWEREAWFELGTERRDYEVLQCKPRLEQEAVEGVVERLNESRDLGPFLKGMRELFVGALR